LSKDDCDDLIILGRIYESNCYEYSVDGHTLGVMFITDGKSPRTELWKKFKIACLSSGMTLRQEGDAEGAFSFDPANPSQAKVAIDGIRARTKRVVSPELAAAAAERFALARQRREALRGI
jgi:hypothetical protein